MIVTVLARVSHSETRGATVRVRAPPLGFVSLNPSNRLLGRVFRLPRHVAAAREKASDGNVLVDLFPMQADAADLDARPRLGTRIQQPRKPGERHLQAAVASVWSTHIMCSSKRTVVAEMVIAHSRSSQGSRAAW